MKKKPEFHGSDLEKIADYYHLDKEKIVLFGANVNPLGLSGQVKKDLAEHLDIISQLSRQRLYRSEKNNCCIYQYLAGTYCCTEMVLRSLSHF